MNVLYSHWFYFPLEESRIFNLMVRLRSEGFFVSVDASGHDVADGDEDTEIADGDENAITETEDPKRWLLRATAEVEIPSLPVLSESDKERVKRGEITFLEAAITACASETTDLEKRHNYLESIAPEYGGEYDGGHAQGVDSNDNEDTQN